LALAADLGRDTLQMGPPARANTQRDVTDPPSCDSHGWLPQHRVTQERPERSLARMAGNRQNRSTRRRSSLAIMARSSCTLAEPRMAEFSWVRRIRYGMTSAIGP